MIEHDLFGRIILMRHWGRIGTRGRERADEHASEVEAAEAMAKLAAAKRRRGYRDLYRRACTVSGTLYVSS
jgi:predicted DNA-binding WGR domain protein